MKLLKYIALAALVLVLISAVSGYIFYKSLHPTYEGTLSMEGLEAPVDVYFDEYGIPHIYAQNEHDAQFALGYLHAQDRLWQMELLRRIGSGRLAEILGEPLVKTDRFFRTINSLETAKKATARFNALPETDPMKRAALAYYDGVNEFVRNGPAPAEFLLLGIEKEERSMLDCYTTFGYMAFSFAQAFRTDPLVQQIAQRHGQSYLDDLDVHWRPDAQMIPVFEAPEITDLPMDEALSINELFESLPSPPWIGSNSWILSGDKTKSGQPLFCNDTHIGFAQPSVWWEAHIEYPGHRSYGNYLAGVPFPVIGHNDHHAIGLTMLENDDIDFYIEKRNPSNAQQVQFRDAWEDLSVREETIRVKDGADVTFQVETSRHGPIVNEVVDGIKKITDQPVAAWWIYNEFIPDNLQSTYQFLRSQTMEEARAAAAMVAAPGLNGMYADREGNIAWWAMAKLPLRPDHVNSKLFLDGASGEDEIQGYLDFSKNPQSENPPTGFVYSANNQPDTTAGIVHLGYYIPEDRARRIVDLLSPKDDWDVPAAKAMITEVVSDKKVSIANRVLELLPTEAFHNETARAAADLLRQWDGDNQLDDLAPTVYGKLEFKLLEAACADEFDERDFSEFLNTVLSRRSIPYLLEAENSAWWDNRTTPDRKETRTDILTQAFSETIDELTEQLGPDVAGWQWGQVHKILHPHTFHQNPDLAGYFDVGPFPVVGNKEVINNMSYSINGSGEYIVTSGPAIRRVIDFADLETSWNVLPTGNSGNLFSPHYDDQAQLFVDGEFRPQLMRRDAIEAVSRTLTLNPKS